MQKGPSFPLVSSSKGAACLLGPGEATPSGDPCRLKRGLLMLKYEYYHLFRPFQQKRLEDNRLTI